MDDAEAQLQVFIDRFDPAIAALARATRVKFRQRFPTAWELVFDNYNACGIGYSTHEKASGVIVSLVLYPRWVTMFFMRGVNLPDPTGRLVGSGSQVRSIRLTSADVFDAPDVKDLIDAAVAASRWPLPEPPGRMLIRTVVAKRRSRRPGPEIH